MARSKTSKTVDEFLTQAKARKRTGALDRSPQLSAIIDRYIERIDEGSTSASCEQVREFIAETLGLAVSVSSIRNWVRERRNAKASS